MTRRSTARMLFDPASYPCTPSAGRRLQELSATVARPARARETRTTENAALIEDLRRIGTELASRFRLRYATLEAEMDGVNAHYGICYRDGRIRIRLRHATTDRVLKKSSLVDTLCHELAHLRHFDHSPRFRRFYLQILDEARKRGHYRPGPTERPSPVPTRSLFGDDACGVAVRPGRRRS